MNTKVRNIAFEKRLYVKAPPTLPFKVKIFLKTLSKKYFLLASINRTRSRSFPHANLMQTHARRHKFFTFHRRRKFFPNPNRDILRGRICNNIIKVMMIKMFNHVFVHNFFQKHKINHQPIFANRTFNSHNQFVRVTMKIFTLSMVMRKKMRRMKNKFFCNKHKKTRIKNHKKRYNTIQYNTKELRNKICLLK